VLEEVGIGARLVRSCVFVAFDVNVPGRLISRPMTVSSKPQRSWSGSAAVL
jgi:hypothetical protein